MKVLIVEDEPLVAMMIEDAVIEAGHEIAGTLGTMHDALGAIASLDFDVALLDMNLGGQQAHPLPVAMTARGKPFAFVTGYGEAGVLAQFRHMPVVTKPFIATEIAEALVQLQEVLTPS